MKNKCCLLAVCSLLNVQRGPFSSPQTKKRDARTEQSREQPVKWRRICGIKVRTNEEIVSMLLVVVMSRAMKRRWRVRVCTWCELSRIRGLGMGWLPVFTSPSSFAEVVVPTNSRCHLGVGLKKSQHVLGPLNKTHIMQLNCHLIYDAARLCKVRRERREADHREREAAGTCGLCTVYSSAHILEPILNFICWQQVVCARGRVFPALHLLGGGHVARRLLAEDLGRLLRGQRCAAVVTWWCWCGRRRTADGSPAAARRS